VVFNFQLINEWIPMFFKALFVTLEIAALSAVCAIVLGSIVASALSIVNRPLGYLLRVYISIFLNSPLLVQLFFLFFGLPLLGIRMNAMMTGVMAITLNEGAFIAEIIRGSINGIPKNDWEAAQSLGLSQFKILEKVIFPQAFCNAIPALTGQISLIIKDTSLLSLIALTELTRVANMIYNKYFDFAGFLFAAIIYIIIFIVINNISFVLEKKYRVKR
jgi:His/Glu/Gln/Arg/opine family amino acid ABC transporter permease subunit